MEVWVGLALVLLAGVGSVSSIVILLRLHYRLIDLTYKVFTARKSGIPCRSLVKTWSDRSNQEHVHRHQFALLYSKCTEPHASHAIVAVRLSTREEAQKRVLIFATRVGTRLMGREYEEPKEGGVYVQDHILTNLVCEPVATMGPGWSSTTFQMVAVVKASVPPTLPALPSISMVSPSFAELW
jgi:hypothetical protein